ncbi:MAG: hypothetical protein SPJ92_08130 [Bariatricus sp.]|nr:hypothetical protein [Bariatricus sp.]
MAALKMFYLERIVVLSLFFILPKQKLNASIIVCAYFAVLSLLDYLIAFLVLQHFERMFASKVFFPVTIYKIGIILGNDE